MNGFLNGDFNLERIQRKFGISQHTMKHLPISEDELKKIYDNYNRWIPKLDDYRAEILKWLADDLKGEVHSIRGRIKEPDHLIEKIIRNIVSKPEKYSGINAENYYKIITDLIGFRVIILDKRDWKDIHKSLLDVFQNIPGRYASKPAEIVDNYDKYAAKSEKLKERINTSYHAERPNVYITSDDDRDIYVDEYLKVDRSKTHYRSIHYIIRYSEVYFEIQVRTIFEEGWLEFDHRITYPYDMGNEKKRKYISMLNSLATAADQLIAFYEDIDFETDDCQKQQETALSADDAKPVYSKKKDFDTLLINEF